MKYTSNNQQQNIKNFSLFFYILKLINWLLQKINDKILFFKHFFSLDFTMFFLAETFQQQKISNCYFP